jgi:hypothetical protein
MPPTLLAFFLAVSILAGGTLTAQTPGFVLSEGPWPGPVNIRARSNDAPSGPAQTVLSSVVFVDAEMTNRTRQAAHRLDRPRRVVHDGIAVLDLPTGGRLMRYRASDSSTHGILHVTSAGRARVVHQRAAGIGGSSPYAPRIAVSTDGLHALVASADELQLWVVRLDGQSYASTGSPARSIPLPTAIGVETLSLTAGAGRAFYVTEDNRLWRLGYDDLATPNDVTPAGQPAGSELEDLMAPSGDGTKVAFLYGPDEAQRIFLIGEVGNATVLAPPPAKYEDPQYLPDSAIGPELLLNESGSRLMYTDSTMHEELYVLDTTGALPINHITADQTFQPYISTVILPVFIDQTLVVGIGDPGAFDIYAASPGNTPAATVDLTATSGTTAPFDSGLLLPQEILPSAGGIAVVTRIGQASQLMRLDLATTTPQMLAQDVNEIALCDSVAGALPDLRMRTTTGDLLLGDASLTAVQTASLFGLSHSVTVGAGANSVRLFEVALGTTGVSQLFAQTPTVGPIPLTAPATHVCASVHALGYVVIESDSGCTLVTTSGSYSVPGAAEQRVLSGTKTR